MTGGRWFYIISLAIGIVLFFTWAYPLRERALSGHNDFLQLYAGARLAGTPELYSIESSKRVHLEVAGTWYPSVYYTRLPFYALILKPLGALPYAQAYWIFQSISISAFALFLYFYLPAYKELALFASLSVPLLTNFANGQDAGLVTAFAGLALVLARRGNDFLAGLLLSLCAIKFHLFVLAPLAVILHRRWRILQGAITGGIILAALSFAAGGLDWPSRYLDLLRNPELHPGPEHTPTLRGLVYVLAGENRALELALSMPVAALFAYVANKTPRFETAFGLSLVAGLLVCHHAYVQDCVLLLLALTLFGISKASPALLGVTMAVVLPPAYFALLHGVPYNAVVPLLLLSILLVACKSAYDRQDRAGAGSPAA